MKLKRGDILNVKGKAWTSWLVKKFTKSEYSHSACYVGDDTVIESYWSGVKLKHISDITDEFDVFSHMDANSEQLHLATQWMMSQIGAKYDYLGLFGIAFSTLGIIRNRNPWDDNSRYWCSELIADGYINAGIELEASKNTFKVSPEDLAQDRNLRKVEFI